MAPADTMEMHLTEDFGEVARGIAGMRVAIVNVGAIRAADGSWFLVDCGLYGSADRIRQWADDHFGSAAPAAILLTHGHFDHVGALEELANGWDVPIYAHRLELPYITGRSKYPPPDPTVGGGAMAWLSPVYPRGPIDVGGRVRTLPEDGSIPGLPGWRWVHTPGHTPGHVSFFRDEDRALVAGDAFVTTKQESLTAVLRQKLEFNGPPAYYTSDWNAAESSVQKLAALQPNTMLCGHGLPVSGPEALEHLEELARHFRQWALPRTGRYVHQPAVSDETGVVSLPPAVAPPMATVVAAGVAAAMVGFAVTRLVRD